MRKNVCMLEPNENRIVTNHLLISTVIICEDVTKFNPQKSKSKE